MSLSKEVGSATSLLVSDKALHLMLHGISGSVAGVLSTLVLYPIDNIKTRLQAQAKGGKEVSDSTEAESPGLPISNKPKTAIEIFKEILEKDGALGLYKGMLPAILGTLVTFGVYFFWYELFKGHFIKDKFSLLGYAITALLSGLITTTCNTPFSVLHTRMLLEKEKMHGLIATIKSIIKKEGPEGLFKGIGASYVLVANPIIQFVIYEYLKKTLKNSKSSAMVFILGALSKSLATMATYPYSTLKTNIQAKKHSNVSQMEMLKKIYENSGLHGFYRGFGTKMYQTVLNSALMLVIYERVQDLVKKILLAILSKK